VLTPGVTAVLLGPSGAGKTTLLNALLPGADLAVAAVREGDARGRHTTTSRQLLAVPGDAAVIDIPGLRSLALDVDEDALRDAFADVYALVVQCRFRDCRHDREPDCAVKAAVKDGSLDADRFASYSKLELEITST
jgi:ribosome biogenesis GTPase